MQEYILNYDAIISKEDENVINTINSFYRTNNFIDFLNYASQKVGFGDDVRSIEFWESMDDYDKTFYDKPFNSVLVEYFDQEVFVNFDRFYYYLEISSKNFIKQNPKFEENVNNLLKIAKENYNL